MKLKLEIEAQIINSLHAKSISVDLDSDGCLMVSECYFDPDAKAGMLYLTPKRQLPTGHLPFAVVSADHIYGVFTFNNKAVIIEFGSNAMEFGD